MKANVRLGVPWVALFLVVSLAGACRGHPVPTELGPGSGRPERASVEVVDLRCEYLEDPLGIDAVRPRLSWRLASVNPDSRGQGQAAYRVLVAGNESLLAKNQGDLWDSGEVPSAESVHIVYGGRPLTSGTECWWKVVVRDEHGVVSPWSKPARWTMGLLDRGDWKAKWIGTGEEAPRKPGRAVENTLADPWFRKSFSLAGKPSRAVIHVASVGYHELYVNGARIGDAVLVPSVADHSRRARYVTYDIRDHLRPGENVLGIWLGVSWSIYVHYRTGDKPQAPIVMAQAEIELPGGRMERIVTDETWKTHPSPNKLLGPWYFMNFGGELYDANREVPGWCGVGLEDSSWKAAAVFSPKLEISAEMVEPNRRVLEIRPVAVEARPGGDVRVDMGVNFTGWVAVDLSGPPGKRIELQFSEREDQAMTHRLRSVYVIGPSGKGTFCNRFNYMTGRWVTIKGLESKPALEDIRGYLVRTDYRRAGRFECSSKLLNDIYNTTLWTFEGLSLGGYVVDCPHRERMGYGGDGHATTEAALNNYHLGAFYTKWAQDWRDVQGKGSAWGLERKEGEAGSGRERQAGNLPYTAPTYWGGGGPAWSGFCVTLPWEVYRRYGDVRILEENMPMIEAWLEFLETKSREDMLVRWGGEWDFLGDWLWPGAKGVNGDTRETLFFNNCYWIYNLETAARIAGVLNRKDAAGAYRQRAETIRRAVHRTFFNPEDHSYVNGFQAYLAIALLVGLPPEDLRPAVWKRLEEEILVRRKGHFHAGITGGYFVIKALLENERSDLILEMASKEDYPGWGDMLRRGATTLWESWEGGNLSLLHSSYLHIGTWFIQGLAGIQPDPEAAGFKSFVIRPSVPSGGRLGWVKGGYDSLYGTIVSEWKVEADRVVIRVSVPPNTKARLYMPAGDVQSIRESGRPLADARGAKLLGVEDRRAVVGLEPGSYSFEQRTVPGRSGR